MAIRDRFRRALRKSVSTGPHIRHTDTNLTTDSNTSNESDQTAFSSFSPSRQPFFSRAFTWGTRRSSRTVFGGSSGGDNSDKDDEQTQVTQQLGLAQQIDLTLTRTASEAEREMKAEKKRQRKAKYKNAGAGIHPRDKPLTAQNLRHQAMLGTWSWDEAVGNSRVSFVDGISPCCTRPPSVHGDYDGGNAGREMDDYFDNGGSTGAPHDNATSAPSAL